MVNTNQPRVTLANDNAMSVLLVSGNQLQGAQPVPQALYGNQNTARPQALFYNLGNNAAIHPQLRPQLVNNSSAAAPLNNPVLPVERPATFTQNVARPTSATTDRPRELTYNLRAEQIRLGTCKFIPDTCVTFKTDGVQFSLKGHKSTPVLLNARAIVKCKVNFSSPYPAFFIHSEASCIGQIQTLFNVPPNAFTDKGPNKHHKYITIFPAKFNREDRQVIMDVFKNMKDKCKWSTTKLQEISTMDALDIIWPPEKPIQRLPTSTASSRPAATRTTMPNQRLPTSTASSRPEATRTTNAIASSAPQHVTNSVMSSQRPALPPVPPLLSNQHRPVTPAPSQPPTTAGQMPSTPANKKLVIPTDEARWQEMKKTLSKGGIYHVVSLDKTEKFCLWNGVDLLPCTDQYREIVLEASHICVGSLKAVPSGEVKVKNDGVSFGINLTEVGQIANVTIPLDVLHNFRVCFHPSLFTIFFNTASPFAATVRATCRMGKSDPTYNPVSQIERQKHIILFLKAFSPGQQESLRKLRINNQPLVQEIQLLQAMQILAEIKSDAALQSKITDYMNGASQSGIESTLDTLKQFVCEVHPPASGSNFTSTHAGGSPADDEVVLTSEEIGIKCAYTQQIMKFPIKNKYCGHNYEKDAILDFIRRRMSKTSGTGNPAKCPFTGCVNPFPLVPSDLEDNVELKSHIEGITKKRSSPP